MNYILKYYYNLENIEAFSMKNKTIFITTSGEQYALQEFNNIEQLNSIIGLLKEMNIENEFNVIVKTNFNENYFEKNNKKYVLIKLSEEKQQRLIHNPIKCNTALYDNIKRNNWYVLWSIKNRKIKELVLSVVKEDMVNEMFDYFMGLAENAILYIKKVSFNEKNLALFISHNRIENNIINSPLNIIIDRRERDYAEMIKYLYFNLDDNDMQLKEVIDSALKENLSLEIIYARVLYPTYYFDYIDENIEIDQIYFKRLLNYESFLKKIYDIISEKKRIKKIDWL